MPAGQEPVARSFYGGLLGLEEQPVPANIAHLGALWFKRGGLRLHLGIEADFRPAKKAHPALLVEGLDLLAAHLRSAGVSIVPADPIQGCNRFHIFDPFGNRLELVEPTA